MENLPSQDSKTGRGLKTGAQATVATIILTAIVNFVVAIWAVPGVPEVVLDFARDYFIQIALLVGISSGSVGYIWNAIFRKDLPNYK